MMLSLRRLMGVRGGLRGAWIPQIQQQQQQQQQYHHSASMGLRTNYGSWKAWHGVGSLVRGLSTSASVLLPQTITTVTMDPKTDMLKVSWGEGGADVYPYVWLRDNCRCPSCYHPGAASRTLLISDLDPDTKPSSVKVSESGGGVDITWSDGHQGTYEAEWLQDRAFNESRRRVRAQEVRLERQYWGSELLKNLPHANFPELLASDEALLTWLTELEIFGFVQIDNAPADVGQVRQLAERVGFVKKTHYGEDFTVVAKPDPSNVAYLSGPLQLHADLPYYQYKPGVQFIHCIVQYAGDGGDSEICDAVHVARKLRDLHPDHYHALTTTPVDWYDVGNDEGREFYKVLTLPMICTDSTGEIVRVNVSQPQRDSHFSVPASEVAPWYRAMLTYHRLLAHPDNCISFKMIPGTILSLDNLRMVHGRSSYKSGHGTRHVEGCYIDWDEVRSRRRVLQRKLRSS